MYHITCNDNREKIHYAGNKLLPNSIQDQRRCIDIKEIEAGEIFQQAPLWGRPEIIGERKRRFVQSHDGIPQEGMGQITISWTHVLPNLN